MGWAAFSPASSSVVPSLKSVNLSLSRNLQFYCNPVSLSKILTLQVSLGRSYTTHCPVIVTDGSSLWELFRASRSFYYLIISGVIWRFPRRWGIESACLFSSLRTQLIHHGGTPGRAGALAYWLCRGCLLGRLAQWGLIFHLMVFPLSWLHGSLWLFLPVSIARNPQITMIYKERHLLEK